MCGFSARFTLSVCAGVFFCGDAVGQFSYQEKVRVSQPTRIDWYYAAAGVSSPDSQDALLGRYNSRAQRYSLFAPKISEPGAQHALILFVTPTIPIANNLLGQTCTRHGVLLAEPFGTANTVSPSKRIRIVLDCLDDVRRRYDIDPDRTYLAGYSGGASIAVRIAVRLPEYFGGVIASNMRFGPPRTLYQIDRLRHRIAFAVLAGDTEKAGFEMLKVQTPVFNGFGIAMRCNVFRNIGHTPPGPAAFESAFQFLESHSGHRKRMANQRAAIRITGNPTREQWSAKLFEEASTLARDDETVPLAIAQLEYIIARWSDVPQSVQANEMLEDLRGRDPKPWVELERRDRLSRTQVIADVYDKAAQVKWGITKMERGIYAGAAIDNYKILMDEAKADEVDDVAIMKRVTFLQPLVQNSPRPVRSVRPAAEQSIAAVPANLDKIPLPMDLSLSGRFTLQLFKERLSPILSESDLRLSFDANALMAKGVSLNRVVMIQVESSPMEDVLFKFLEPQGLSYKFDAATKTIHIVSK